jgi:phage tail sheath protein FI
MPDYLSPGVYIEEIDAGPRPIVGVSTSIAGAVGVTAKGPTDGKPRLVTSFPDFVRQFGGFLTPPDAPIRNAWDPNPTEGGRWWWFPLSVKGFFDNGGSQLYVKRVFATNAVPSTAMLGRGLVSHVMRDEAVGSTRLLLSHVFGIDETTNISLFDGATNQQIGGGFAIDAYDGGTGQIEINPALPADVVAARGDFVEIVARSPLPLGAPQETLQFDASSRGEWGDAIRVMVEPVAEATMTLLNDPVAGGAATTTTVTGVVNNAGPPPSTTVTVATVAGLSNTDHVDIAGGRFEIANVDAANNRFDIDPPLTGNQTIRIGAAVRRLRPAAANGATTILVFGADRLFDGALVELDNGTDKDRTTVASIAGDTVTLAAALANDYLEGDRLRVIGAQVTATYDAGDGTVPTSEMFGPLRLLNDGGPSSLVTQVNQGSALVRVSTRAGYDPASLAAFPTSTGAPLVTLIDGDDDLDNLAPEDFVGVDRGGGQATGIEGLTYIDEISICTAPNMWAGTIRSALITHCELLKDRFAIVDVPDGLDNENLRAVREPIDTSYAALYYPWLVVRDPLARRDVRVGPSGHMAGIYARVDQERGVHKAPANVVIRNIQRLGQDITKREQDMLNPKGINILRAFPNLGARVWGARTLSSNTTWRYINVRRLFIFVEESIEEGTQWVVFEPNDEPLWARVRQSVTNFLTTVWRSGALEGATPDEAFFVVCDRTSMSQDDIDNGRLICLIGIAPVRPAEFVIFRIQQKTRELVPA